MSYKPDNWVLLKFQNESFTRFKILAGWYGGYLHGDSWKLSSRVERLEEDEHSYTAINGSGSVYVLNKQSERLSGYTASILAGFMDDVKDSDVIITQAHPSEWQPEDDENIRNE